jgi:hypothetical protein
MATLARDRGAGPDPGCTCGDGGAAIHAAATARRLWWAAQLPERLYRPAGLAGMHYDLL